MNCIAYEKPKLAALLFESVIPVPSPNLVISPEVELSDFVDVLHDKAYEGATVTQIKEILPNEVDAAYLAGILAYSTIEHLSKQGDKTLERYVELFKSHNDDMSQLLTVVYDLYTKTFDLSYLQRQLIESFALTKIKGSGFEIFGINKRSEMEDIEPTPFLELSNVPIIDESQLSWEHVLEVRNDKSSIQKLRRFRSFAFDNYKGKSSQEIEDDLLTRIYDFEKASNNLGLQTLKTVFSVGGSEKVATALSTGIMASLFGAPITLAAAVGASAVLSGVLVQVVTHRKLFELEQDKDPVRYLIDIRKKCEDG